MSHKAMRLAILSVLERLGEPMSTRCVADILEMDWRTAYGHLTALERQGLVEHHRENGVHTWAVQIKGRVPIKEL